MANGKTHAAVRIAAGSMKALYGARYLTPLDQFLEGVGGGVGGYFGGKLPDVIEPAIHSWYRGFAHSWTVGLGLLLEELGLEHELIDVLANWPGREPAFLLIDALDAARTDPAGKAIRDFIRGISNVSWLKGFPLCVFRCR